MLKNELHVTPEVMQKNLENMKHYQSCDAFIEFMSDTTGKMWPKDVCQSQEDIDAWIAIQMYQIQNNFSGESGVKISSCMEQAGFGERWSGLFPRARDCLID